MTTRNWRASSQRLRARARPIADKVRADQLGVHAGSLTYASFLAIPPALVLAVSVVSLVLANDPEAQQRLIDEITAAVPGLQETMAANFSIVPVGQLGVGVIGILGLLWAASGFAARIRIALGVVFHTGSPSLLKERLSGVLIGIPSFVGFAALVAFAGYALGLSAPWWVRVIAGGLVLAVSAVLFTLLYWALTPLGPGRPTLRDHVPGAVAFAVAASIVERAGGAYVAYVIAHATALYGAIGAIFGLLAFLYATMWIFLVGAEISEAVRLLRTGSERFPSR